ncbi:MAG: ABC transporter substrate-binding protein, partial [Thermomicrobiales bacterium]|nr:ABC transporter substrate-binding protein [Thermomicrobiales bacterium]
MSRSWLGGAAMALATALAGGALAQEAAAPPPPQRIVSINVCADQLLLALADPEQIASLSNRATDPELSYLAGPAAEFPHAAFNAESVVRLQPDLILAGRLTRLATREMLGRLGYEVVLLNSIRSVDAGIEQIREIAALVGHPERGEALVADIEAALAEAAALPPPGGATVAAYQRRGYLVGTSSLITDLLARIGLTNAADGFTAASGGYVRLEEIVAGAPDYLVVAALDTTPGDQGMALLAHPALERLYPLERRIVLPDR